MEYRKIGKMADDVIKQIPQLDSENAHASFHGIKFLDMLEKGMEEEGTEWEWASTPIPNQRNLNKMIDGIDLSVLEGSSPPNPMPYLVFRMLSGLFSIFNMILSIW